MAKKTKKKASKKTTSKKKVKTKLTTPTVSLARAGYKFTLSFSNIDNDADHIFIERWIYEVQDTKKSSNKAKEYKKVRRDAKKTSSWSYTLKEDHYYPFVKDGTDSKPLQSDYSQRIKKVVFKVWTTGVVNKKSIQSSAITKTYSFKEAKKPNVGIAYDENGTSFTFTIDINDDYSINDSSKQVATRCWGWLTSQAKGGKEVKVSGYTGKWYNRDATSQIRNKITTEISPKTPVKYTVHAYSAGPGGKSDVKTASHILAVPKPPLAPKITIPNVLKNTLVGKAYGLYDLSWNIDTGKGWYPVDNVTIQYRDQDMYKESSDIYGMNMGTWSTAKDNIDASIKKIRSNELGAPAADTVRYFRLLVKHDGNETPGYVTGVVDYGRPTNVSGVTATTTTVGGKDAILFKWTAPTTKLYGTDPNTVMYTGEKLGAWGCARISIYKNSYTTKNCIKTIRYTEQKGWGGNQFLYYIPESDIGKEIDYGFQVRVGLDSGKPGARSDVLWLERVVVPSKCKNVTGTKMSNNTTVELTWDNPAKDDTVRNGVEIAWSTFLNAWESNESPSTTTFSNGSMTKAYITGLTAGEIYYFWVRLYEETEDSTSYGEWSDPSPGVLMSDDPDTPILTLSRSWIKKGGNLSAQWLYSANGNMPQTSAQVEISNNKTKWTPIATVTGEEDNCLIDLSEKVNNSYKYPIGDYFIRVTVSNVTGSSTSEPADLRIANPPSCIVTSDSIVDYTYTTDVDDTGTTESTTAKTLRNLPLKANVGLLAGNADMNLYIYCIDDFKHEHPDSVDEIFQGDCVWTSPVEAGNITIDNVNLADNAKYRLQLECVDPETLLAGEPRYIDFEVHWEHQAVEPDQSTVTIEVDEEGNTTATLVPVKPEGASDTDVCDIYRTTADGRYLCRRDVPWGRSVLDVLPTFGESSETAYCFCTRTTNGDEAWVDMTYELVDYGITINYGEQWINLPWNVTIDDSRTKQGEIRSHLGGTKLYFGQPHIERSQNLSTEVVKMEDEDLVEQLYELSRFTDLCYVRTSNCIGYPATVDVSINREYNNNIVSVSITAKEADANGEFQGELLPEETTTE